MQSKEQSTIAQKITCISIKNKMRDTVEDLAIVQIGVNNT